MLKEAADDDASVLDAYALGILQTLDDVSLAVLAALAAVPAAATVNFRSDPVPEVHFVCLPAPQIVVGEFDWKSPRERGFRVKWPWPMLKEAVLELRHAGLVHFHTFDARGGYGNIYLSELGQTVVACTAFPSLP